MKSLQSLLVLRARHAALFAEGEYAPLSVSGQRAGNVIAFTRTHKILQAVVIAQLRCARALNSEAATAKEWWGDTRIDGLPRLLQWWLPQLKDSELFSPNVADYLAHSCVVVAIGNRADPKTTN
jgi:maltooligosyltrehalose synthase